MFNVNHFTIIGKYIKTESIRNKLYLYIMIENNKVLRIIIAKGIKDKITEFCTINETIAVKGYISTNEAHETLLQATQIMFLSNKN